jgi:hypothetical protein
MTTSVSMRIQIMTFEDGNKIIYIMGSPVVDDQLTTYGVLRKSKKDHDWKRDTVIESSKVKDVNVPNGTIIDTWEDGQISSRVIK